jgi:hypothetical protein
MREVKTVLGHRILIKKLEGVMGIGDMVIEDDGESLPQAEVVLLGEDITQVNIGDFIHYTESRETGKCSHNGAEHYIIPISNAVAII